jgi:hypothetical protein
VYRGTLGFTVWEMCMEFVLQETATDLDKKNENIVLHFVLLVLLLQLDELANYTDMCTYNYRLSAFQRVC